MEQKKIVQKIIDAANSLKGKEFIPASFIWAPWVPVAGLYLTEESKYRIMTVKEWLKEKRSRYKKFEADKHAYGIDAEEELTRILTEEIAKEMEKSKTVHTSWINKNIRNQD